MLVDICRRKIWVSLKILTADAISSSNELELNQSLSAHHGRTVSGSEYIPEVLDHFVHAGPNGKHQCLVFELLGPSLEKVIQDIEEYGLDRLKPETIFRICDQLFKALAFMHDAGYKHGGK